MQKKEGEKWKRVLKSKDSLSVVSGWVGGEIGKKTKRRTCGLGAVVGVASA